MLSPVEYLSVHFTKEQFAAAAAPALADLVDRGLIHIIDLVFVGKSDDGSVQVTEVDDLDDDTRHALDLVHGEYGGLLSDEDIAMAAAPLTPGTGEFLVVWENLWAAPLMSAIREAGGAIDQDLHIPAEAAESAYSSLSVS